MQPDWPGAASPRYIQTIISTYMYSIHYSMSEYIPRIHPRIHVNLDLTALGTRGLGTAYADQRLTPGRLDAYNPTNSTSPCSNTRANYG